MSKELSQTEYTEIISLATKFAEDFEIPYDKIKFSRKSQVVTFKREANSSGGWTEGVPGTTIPIWLMKKHYKLIQLYIGTFRTKTVVGVIDFEERL